jgi:hypothetical protein
MEGCLRLSGNPCEDMRILLQLALKDKGGSGQAQSVCSESMRLV